MGGGSIDFGAPVLDFAAGGVSVIEGGAVVLTTLASFGTVLTPTLDNAYDEISAITEEEIETFLCENY